jgi:restriction system protein
MWIYGDAGRLLTLRGIGSADCVYCQHTMHRMNPFQVESGQIVLLIQMSMCVHCGWWRVYRVHHGENPRTRDLFESYSAAIGSLKELDVEDISAPLDELRQYLVAKRDAVFRMHPRSLERLVCGIFQAFGWNARVTAYSGDQGVDVILEDSSGKTVGVEVKRYKSESRIGAEQIRSLAGALLLNGHTRGMFVATTTFTSGARRTAGRLSSIGHPIELVDAERFFEALGIAHRKQSPLDEEELASHVLAPGFYVGAGLRKDLEPGEDLVARELLAQIWTRDELVELKSEALAQAPAPT